MKAGGGSMRELSMEEKLRLWREKRRNRKVMGAKENALGGTGCKMDEKLQKARKPLQTVGATSRTRVKENAVERNDGAVKAGGKSEMNEMRFQALGYHVTQRAKLDKSSCQNKSEEENAQVEQRIEKLFKQNKSLSEQLFAEKQKVVLLETERLLQMKHIEHLETTLAEKLNNDNNKIAEAETNDAHAQTVFVPDQQDQIDTLRFAYEVSVQKNNELQNELRQNAKKVNELQEAFGELLLAAQQ